MMETSESYVEQLEEENERLREENRQLKNRVEELETKVEQLLEELTNEKQKKRRQAAPFRQESEDEEESPGHPGREEGHKGEYREPAEDREPDRIESARLPEECDHCGGDLTRPGALHDPEVHVQYQDHLELVHECIQFNVETGHCSECGEHLVGTHPQRDSEAIGAAGNTLSDEAKALASELKYHHGLPFRTIAEMFNDYTGMPVSAGGLYQAARRMSEGLESTYEWVQTQLRQSDRVHSDETGWRIGGDNAWLWDVTNDVWVFYEIARSRAHDVIEVILGTDFDGILESDCYPAYDVLGYDQQKCVAHLIRRAHQLEEDKTRRAVCFGRDVKDCFQDALKVWRQQDSMSDTDYRQKAQQIDDRMDEILDRTITEEDNARFQRCLKKQRPHLFRFLWEDEAVPTNNQAERDLRGAVIARKRSGCNKTDTGARTYAIIKTVCETARKQEKKILDILSQAFGIRRRGDPVSLL